MAVWTPAQLAQFLASIAAHRLFAAFRLIAMRGLRRGDACGLRWEDLDLDEGRAYVSRQVQHGAEGRLRACPLKTESSCRAVALDPQTVIILRAHRSLQRRWLSESGIMSLGWGFADDIGGPLSPDCLTRTFNAMAGDSGLSPVRLHDLRHNAATQFASDALKTHPPPSAGPRAGAVAIPPGLRGPAGRSSAASMSAWPVVLSLGGVRSRGIAGAVQEYRGDERDCELVDGEVAAERPVVDAAAQKRLDHRPDLLFGVPGVVRGAEPAGDGGVLAAAGGDHAGDAGDGLAHGDGVQVGFGEPGGDGVAGGGGQGLEQPVSAGNAVTAADLVSCASEGRAG